MSTISEDSSTEQVTSSDRSQRDKDDERTDTVNIHPDQSNDYKGSWSSATRLEPIFSFASNSLLLNCRYEQCTITANSKHPTSVICPRCTKYSYNRYCSLSHLTSDIRNHFTSPDCGTGNLLCYKVDEESFLPSSLPIRPYIHETWTPGKTGLGNVLKRHRQALYRSMSPTIMIDYYIFDDIDLIALSDDVMSQAPDYVRKLQVQTVRGHGQVHATVELPIIVTQKIDFNKCIDACLKLGPAAGYMKPDECQFMYLVIKQELEQQELWDGRMEERVAVQMGFEFGWKLPLYLRAPAKPQQESGQELERL